MCLRTHQRAFRSPFGILRGMRLGRGRKTPSGSTGMSSAATFGSATDDPVHPARESFAPLSNNVHAKKNGETEKESYFPPCNNVYTKKREMKDRAMLCPHLISERFIEILSYLLLLVVLHPCLSVIFPSPEYQQAGRGRGRSMDGRACRSRYRR